MKHKPRAQVCQQTVFFIVMSFRLSSPLLPLSSAFQACGDPKAKPSYLVDKNLESAVKFIVRKFPAVETRNNNVSTNPCVCLHDTRMRVKEEPPPGAEIQAKVTWRRPLTLFHVVEFIFLNYAYSIWSVQRM